LSDSLIQCGIQAPVTNYSPEEFYAAGPNGLLFGRKFDFAQFAMGTMDIQPACNWYTTVQIPNAANNWIGTNVSGFSNTEFDKGCQSAEASLPGDEAYKTGYERTQYIFAEELPSIPLYWRLKVAASRADLCNFVLDATSITDLWNIEMFDYGSGCSK
jgi:peptide/nickel transport system substrate-binding protein